MACIRRAAVQSLAQTIASGRAPSIIARTLASSVGIEPVHQLARRRRLPHVQRLAVAGLARLDGRRGVLDADERNPHGRSAEAEQVFGDPVARAPIVDADEIVDAALRIGHHRAIEQHDRNARGVERLRDLQIDRVLVRRQLERGEEHAGDAAVDELAAQLPRAVGLRRGTARQAAPEERMLPRQRRRHHPLTDRLEDLGLAQIRNEQPEEPRVGAGCAPSRTTPTRRGARPSRPAADP